MFVSLQIVRQSCAVFLFLQEHKQQLNIECAQVYWHKSIENARLTEVSGTDTEDVAALI